MERTAWTERESLGSRLAKTVSRALIVCGGEFEEFEEFVEFDFSVEVKRPMILFRAEVMVLKG